MNLRVIHSGCYTQAQHHTQVAGHVFLGLTLSGQEFCRVSFPSGRRIGMPERMREPCLTLIPENFKIEFEFNALRENWVIQCKLPDLKWRDGQDFSTLDFNGSAIALPFFLPLTPEHGMVLRGRFERITALSRDGIPVNVLAAELLAAAVIVELLTPDLTMAQAEDAADKLKRAIDEDTGFVHTLEELNRKTGFSVGHTRKLFVRRFQIEPGEYRARQRLYKIMNLFGQTELSTKEVAYAVGMSHVTHLYAFLKEHCGMTPGQLRKQYRN